MKWIISLIMTMFLLGSCAQKPAIPKDIKQRSHTSQNSYGNSVSHSNNGKPKLPHQRSTKPGKESKSNRRVLSPSQIFEKLSPAVFKIYTSTGTEGYQGSGFFISSNGVAVSNYHVFQGTAIGYENIVLSNGQTYKLSKVYHKSKENDFIIFKVDVMHQVDYVRLSKATPKVGEKIYTIGTPRGLDNTFSSGEISQIRDHGKILQISAPIDHGSSGGVLLNTYGEAVGITSGGIDDSGANLNFAWSIEVIKPYIP